MAKALRLALVAALIGGATAWAQTPPDSARPATQIPPAAANLPANVNTKGVRVLMPEETPGAGAAPAPSPVAPATVTKPPVPAPIVQLCARPFPTTDVRWDGVTKIDAVLAKRLKTRQRVVVDLAQPYPERNAPPAALSRWLSEVEKGGGAVTVKQYCKAARGGLGSWLAQLADSLGGGKMYRAARDYDVVLHSDALDRVVTQVEFVPKSAAL